MDALFKKFVNTGVGYVAQGTKLVQATIEKLVEENKLSEQEGQKIVADLLQSGEAKRADLEKQFKRLTTDLRARVGLAAEEAPAPAAKPAPRKPASHPAAKATGAPGKAASKGKASVAATKAQPPAATKTGATGKQNEKA